MPANSASNPRLESAAGLVFLAIGSWVAMWGLGRAPDALRHLRPEIHEAYVVLGAGGVVVAIIGVLLLISALVHLLARPRGTTGDPRVHIAEFAEGVRGKATGIASFVAGSSLVILTTWGLIGHSSDRPFEWNDPFGMIVIIGVIGVFLALYGIMSMMEKTHRNPSEEHMDRTVSLKEASKMAETLRKSCRSPTDLKIESGIQRSPDDRKGE